MKSRVVDSEKLKNLFKDDNHIVAKKITKHRASRVIDSEKLKDYFGRHKKVKISSSK